MKEEQALAHFLLLIVGVWAAGGATIVESRAGKIALAAFALLCVAPVFLRLWFFAVLG